MIIDAATLRGFPKERAELYGKPHLGARYTHGKAYEALSQRCCICGMRAGSVHHVAHRSWGEKFRLVTPRGAWDLLSPLFCLCGSGTTGCHDGFHAGARLKAVWEWRAEEYEEAWWSGELLQAYAPHDPGLYEYGYWLITDRDGAEIIRERMYPWKSTHASSTCSIS